MRIGIDASPLRVPSGGIRRYTEELIDGLLRSEPRHHYVLYHAPRNRNRLASRPFAEIDRDPLDFPGKRYVDAIHLARASRTIDLYHGTNYSVPLFTQVPTVVTVHDLSVQLVPQSHPMTRRMKHRLLPTICRRATRIIADSQQTRQDLVRLFELDENKIDVVHLGVRPEDIVLHPGGVAARVIAHEYHGDHQILEIEPGDLRLAMRVVGDAAPAPGETVQVAVKRAHFFDPLSGVAVAHATYRSGRQF